MMSLLPYSNETFFLFLVFFLMFGLLVRLGMSVNARLYCTLQIHIAE